MAQNWPVIILILRSLRQLIILFRVHRLAVLSECNRGGQCKCVEVINTRRIKFDYLKKLYAAGRAGVA